jgi:RNA polymerase sigma-70 factor (sigma-E family)
MQQSDGFTEFATVHATSLVRLAYALCGDRGRSEEIAQEALERLFVKWSRVDDPVGYARRIVLNLTRDRWRRVGRHEHVGLDDVAQRGSEPAREPGERILLLEALRQLPHGQRAVLVARYWLDLSEAETAAALGVGLGTVKSQASRGLRRLRELLAEDLTETAGGVRP